MSDILRKTKRKALTLNCKYDIIKRLQRHAKQSEICSEMGLSKSTVRTIQYAMFIGNFFLLFQ